jgi:hypothetical protein
MNVPACRHLVAAAFVLGVWLAASTMVHADCGGDNSGSSSGVDTSNWDTFNPGSSDVYDTGFSTDISGFIGMDDPGWDNTMTAWNFFAASDNSGDVAQVMNANSSGGGRIFDVSVDALQTVYAGSPTQISSIAYFVLGLVPFGHTIDYINVDDYNAGGAWTMNVDPDLTLGSLDSAGFYSRNIQVTYPTPGTYYVRAGVDIQSAYWGFVYPYIYSQTITVTVLDPITNYTVSIQTHPKPGMEKWVLPSHQVTKPFQVFHSN